MIGGCRRHDAGVTVETPYDAVLVLSFGGPEGPDDVLPFMEQVTRGRGIPRERLVEVSAHYDLFGGVSPINALNRDLMASLRIELDAADLSLPIYWGNRNWHPFLVDTVRQMAADGVRRVAAFVTSAFGSASGCRQYREDIAAAIETVRAERGDAAPVIDKLRLFWNHPGFLHPIADATAAALVEAGPDAALVFTAHSIPASMAATAPYVDQLTAASRWVASQVGRSDWDIVYQSRSGPPQVPWLEPDVNDHLRALRSAGTTVAVVVPIGFVSDHMEVLYDLDTQAAETAAEIGMRLIRVPTPGPDVRFVRMVVDLVRERIDPATPRQAVEGTSPWPDTCPAGCCAAAGRPGS
jgi:protoporphyrin/coproporphyrin ferrochelatase